MSDENSITYLPSQALSQLDISALQVVELMEKLIRDRAASKVWSAPKASVALPDDRYVMSTMAIADDPPYLALKSLLLNPRNPSQGEPLMNSIVTLQDSETGRPLAVLDGNWITAVRTAAMSLLAARRMANPDSQVIAFIGCGVQARNHLRVMADAFPLSEARVLGRGRYNIDAFCSAATDLGLTPHVATGPEDALRGADLVVSSVTRAKELEPFVDASAVEPGAFASLTDLGRPWLSDTLGAFDCIIVDDKAQEAVMKDPMIAPDRMSGDLTDLVLDRVTPEADGRKRAAFIFRGHALGDFALAALAYKAATTAG